MRLVFILFLISTFFLISLKSRIAGLYTYWWFAIFRPHEWVWSPIISDLRLPLVAALILVVPSLLQKKFPQINHPLAFLMLIWMLLVYIADTLNGCSTMTAFRTNTVFELFVLIYIVLLTSRLIDNPKSLFWLIAVLSASIAFHSGKGGIYSLITRADNYGATNLGGLFSGSNAYALGTGLLLFFMIFSFQHIDSFLVYKKMGKWYNRTFILNFYKFTILIFILGSVYNIISLQSRGAFIATALGLFLWLILQKKVTLVVLVASLALLTLSGTFNKFLPEGYVDRIESVFADDEDLDKSAASRPHFWKTAVKIANVYPTGVGPGCYPGYYDYFDSSEGYYGHSRSVHSSHFQILADSGYLGLIVWILLFLISYTRLWKIKIILQTDIMDEAKRKFYNDLTNMLICSQTVFLLGGSFYEYAYNDITWITFALVIVIDTILKKELENKLPPKNIRNHFT